MDNAVIKESSESNKDHQSYRKGTDVFYQYFSERCISNTYNPYRIEYREVIVWQEDRNL